MTIEADSNPEGQIRVQALAEFLFVQKSGFEFIKFVASIFPRVELMEQCGYFYKMRVPREDKTIGYLFGLIEQKKNEFRVQEYSVSQTSLE